MVEKVSKRSLAIGVMNANADKPMAEVVALIAKAIDVTEANAKSYYRWIVANKLAVGTVEKTVRAVKVKVEKPAKVKPVKAPKAEKPADEVAAIKAANFARMKAVTAAGKGVAVKGRKNYGNRVAAPAGPGVENFDPAVAKAEVAAFIETGDVDSFMAPRELSKDELKAII